MLEVNIGGRAKRMNTRMGRTGQSLGSAGDVLFAYFTALGKTGLDPFVHAAYILSYGLIAAGMRRHLALVES